MRTAAGRIQRRLERRRRAGRRRWTAAAAMSTMRMERERVPRPDGGWRIVWKVSTQFRFELIFLN